MRRCEPEVCHVGSSARALQSSLKIVKTIGLHIKGLQIATAHFLLCNVPFARILAG